MGGFGSGAKVYADKVYVLFPLLKRNPKKQCNTEE